MEKITSRNNRLIKDTGKLFTSSRARQDAAAFVLEGARLCFDVLHSVYQVKTFLITEEAYAKYRDSADLLIARAEQAFFISPDVAAKLSDTAASQGIFAVCRMKSGGEALGGKTIIALDCVSDPSNVGAIIRTAEALGIDTVLAYRCCDIYNPKTLRASMGSVLRMNICFTDNLEDTLTALKKTHRVYATVPSQDAQSITEVDFSVPSVCVIGNEANGVEKEIQALSHRLVTIPMLGRAESLNAGTAASIVMWEMLR